MKMALMLAAAGATGRFPGGPRDLLERGTKMLASSPELAKIGDTVRGELVNAAKEAAVTATSRRIDSLSNRLQSGGQVVTGTVSDVTDTVDDVTKVGKFGRKKRARSRADEDAPADEQPENDYADEEDEADDYEEPDEDEADEEPTPPRRPAARRRSTGGSTRPTSKSGTTKSHEDDDEEAPARKRRTRAKATTESAPVRRARG